MERPNLHIVYIYILAGTCTRVCGSATQLCGLLSPLQASHGKIWPASFRWSGRGKISAEQSEPTPQDMEQQHSPGCGS